MKEVVEDLRVILDHCKESFLAICGGGEPVCFNVPENAV